VGFGPDESFAGVVGEVQAELAVEPGFVVWRGFGEYCGDVGIVALARKTQASPSTAARSDGERELGERSRELMPRVYVSGKFVVAAANVLDKGMADADHP
jgi:hypothetical protein